jgi:hypothetical protein
MRDVLDAEIQTYNNPEKDDKLIYDFTNLRACIQQQQPTLLECVELVHWCANSNCNDLMKILLDPKLSPFAIKGML